MLTLLILAILLVLLGIILLAGKGSFLIAGLNTMPQKERDKYNIPNITRFVGRLLLICGFILLAIYIVGLLWVEHFNTITIIGTIIIFLSVVASVIYINISSKFKV